MTWLVTSLPPTPAFGKQGKTTAGALGAGLTSPVYSVWALSPSTFRVALSPQLTLCGNTLGGTPPGACVLGNSKAHQVDHEGDPWCGIKIYSVKPREQPPIIVTVEMGVRVWCRSFPELP